MIWVWWSEIWCEFYVLRILWSESDDLNFLMFCASPEGLQGQGHGQGQEQGQGKRQWRHHDDPHHLTHKRTKDNVCSRFRDTWKCQGPFAYGPRARSRRQPLTLSLDVLNINDGETLFVNLATPGLFYPGQRMFADEACCALLWTWPSLHYPVSRIGISSHPTSCGFWKKCYDQVLTCLMILCPLILMIRLAHVLCQLCQKWISMK